MIKFTRDGIRLIQSHYPMRMHRYLRKYLEYVTDNSKTMPEDDPRLTAADKYLIIQTVNYLVHPDVFKRPAVMVSFDMVNFMVNYHLPHYLMEIHKLMVTAAVMGEQPFIVHRKVAEELKAMFEAREPEIHDSPMVGDTI